MPKALDEKEKKPAAVDKPLVEETATTPAKKKYVVKGGNIKNQKKWYKEGQDLEMTDEELDKLPGEVKEKLHLKGGE